MMIALLEQARITPAVRAEIAARAESVNGMIERFNGRISDVLKTHHFSSALDLEQTLPRCVAL